MADPKTAVDAEPGIEQEAPQEVDISDVDTEGGRTDVPKRATEEAEPEAVEEDAPRSRPDTEEGDEAERRKHGRSARAKREAQRRAKERDKAELAALRAEVAQLKTGQTQITESQRVQGQQTLKNQLDAAAQRIINAEMRIAKAVSDSDGETYRSALRDYTSATIEAQQYSAALEYVTRGNGDARQPQPERTEQPQPRTPVLNADGTRMKDDFLDEFSWIDPEGADADSRRVLLIDRAVANERFDRNTPEYWDEVRARMREDDRLTHRLNGKQPVQRKAAGGPPISGSRDALAGPSNGKITVPAEMVKMMKDTGQWDDLKRRNAVIKDYVRGVKEQQAGAR